MTFYTPQASFRKIIEGWKTEVFKPLEIVVFVFPEPSQQAPFENSSIFILVRFVLTPPISKIFFQFFMKLFYIFFTEAAFPPRNGILPVL